MNILVTGNKGYIGSVLTEVLQERGHEVVGYDVGYYDQNELYVLPRPLRQISKDIRDISAEDLAGIDAVAHLAALSNDPLGELASALTEEINLRATVRLAQLARAADVRRFVFSSSASIYGIADTQAELGEQGGKENPITAYARSKLDAERALKQLGSDGFVVVCLRSATAFGASPSLRCDLVLNNLVASAHTTGRIEIKSDGTPWRPMVHVRDISHAFVAALEAPTELVEGESFNVGTPNGNFTVRDLAEAAQRVVPGSSLVFTGEHGSDARTYRVNFSKILTVLKDYYKPEWNIDRGAEDLVRLFRKVNFSEEHFRGRICNRLLQIKFLMGQGRLDENLRWI